MIRKVAAGLAGLGLIGGAGSVVYNNHGDATVKIKDAAGQTQTVHLAGEGGAFSCPQGTHDKLEPYDLELGGIKLTAQRVHRQLRKIAGQYPSHTAPGPVVDRYNALASRERRLVSAFNTEAVSRNAILKRDCQPAGMTGLR